MKKILLSFILTFPVIHFSQILNVDRENGQDTIKKKLAFSSVISFSIDKQKNNLLETSNNSELDVFTKKDRIWILLAHTDASFNGTKTLENNGYFQTRFRDNDTRKVAADFFLQYQWNGILGLQNRGLGGVNARFRLFEKKANDMYLSTGLFYEVEKWNPELSSFGFDKTDLEVVHRQIPRLNIAFKTAHQFKKGIDISASSFVQFPMNQNFTNFLNPRWFFDVNLFFKINKHLHFNIHYNHNLDNYRPFPIDDYYYSLIFGLQLQW